MEICLTCLWKEVLSPFKVRGGETQGRAQRVNLLARFVILPSSHWFHWLIVALLGMINKDEDKRWLMCIDLYRSAMATEREDDVSDEQESETDDCDTEEDEGKIIFRLGHWREPRYTVFLMFWLVTNIGVAFFIGSFAQRQDKVEEGGEDLPSNDDHRSHRSRLRHLSRASHVPGFS